MPPVTKEDKKSSKAEPMDTDAAKTTEPTKEDKAKEEKAAATLVFEDLKEQCRLIERGESTKEPRFIARILRGLVSTRKKLTPSLLTKLIAYYFMGPSNTKQKEYLLQYLQTPVESMDVDNKPGLATAVAPRSPRPKRPGVVGTSATTPDINLLPEVEAYVHLLVLLYLLDKKRVVEAEKCSTDLLEKLGTYNRRTLDPLSAKAIYYHCLIQENLGKLSDIRTFLHTRLRTATLRHDEDSQATLVNCLLRSYIQANMYDLAGKLVAKVTFPESANNNEWARFLYYLGCIKAMQLEYPAAHKHLMQAIRKAPQFTAVGFKQVVQKLLLVVELLLGEIPERSLFRQPMFRKCLVPYFNLTRAVRGGDIKQFDKVLAEHESAFRQDKTHSLIVRLRQNVIRTAVKRIALAYSRISIEDIQKKLQLSHPDDAEYIVSKAIRDGVVEAGLNHDDGWMQSRETTDIYHTAEPQQQLHSRISFCLDIYNQSVKAMRFPPKSYNKELESAQERREREQQDLEFAKEMAEEDDDGFP